MCLGYWMNGLGVRELLVCVNVLTEMYVCMCVCMYACMCMCACVCVKLAFVTRLCVVGALLRCLEFVAVMSRKVNSDYTSEQVKRSFQVRTACRHSSARVFCGIVHSLRTQKSPKRSMITFKCTISRALHTALDTLCSTVGVFGTFFYVPRLQIFENPKTPGLIHVDDLTRALTTYGSNKLSLEQAQELVSQLEPNATGMVNYVDYVNM